MDKRKNNGAIRDENRPILDEHIFETILELESGYGHSDDALVITKTALIKEVALINPNEIEHKKA